MSEYQYYEFQAVDRPLSGAERERLRAISSRATITATSFTNSYDYGDLKGDPRDFMRQWFDLHLYMANWQSRRVMIRLPARLVDRALLEACIRETDEVEIESAGDNFILDIMREEIEGDGDWEDGSGRLAAMAPLRANLLGGDQRLFYLFWLMAVQYDVYSDEAQEPLPGIGPLSAPLAAFADFFGIDRDLVDAAAEREPFPPIAPDAIHVAVAAIDGDEKTALLIRLLERDPHVAAKLARRVQADTTAKVAAVEPRTVGVLRARAVEIGEARKKAAQEAAAAKEARRAAEAARLQRARLDTLKRRGDSVWREVETEIERRNAAGYDAAAGLLRDLHALAAEQGTSGNFARRLDAIRAQHASKRTFVTRLDTLGV